jgi:hypothetical protein
MILSPTETFAITRKSLADLTVSCDTKPEALRSNLSKFNQDIIRTVTTKRLKNARLVLLEVDKGED